MVTLKACGHDHTQGHKRDHTCAPSRVMQPWDRWFSFVFQFRVIRQQKIGCWVRRVTHACATCRRLFMQIFLDHTPIRELPGKLMLVKTWSQPLLFWCQICVDSNNLKAPHQLLQQPMTKCPVRLIVLQCDFRQAYSKSAVRGSFRQKFCTLHQMFCSNWISIRYGTVHGSLDFFD